MTAWEEVQKFCAQANLGEPTLMDGDVAHVPLENFGILTVDISIEDCVFTYIFVEHRQLTPRSLLRALQECDPARLLGFSMNFAANEEGNVGFLISIPRNQFYASTLTLVFGQLLQTLTKFAQF